MKLRPYLLFTFLIFAAGCNDHGENICDAFISVKEEIRVRKGELSDSQNRKPASSDLLEWSETLIRRLQWARDHFESDRSKEKALAYLTQATDQTTFLFGYLEKGKRSRSLETLNDIEIQLDHAYAAGCGSL